MSRVLGLDYGAARCGVALSDPTGTVVTPLEPVLQPATKRGYKRVLEAIRASSAQRVVVGLPLSLSGADSSQTEETRAWADRLGRSLAAEHITVELYDERFTTRIAQQRGGSAAEDSVAAAVLLEDWLVAQSATESAK